MDRWRRTSIHFINNIGSIPVVQFHKKNSLFFRFCPAVSVRNRRKWEPTSGGRSFNTVQTLITTESHWHASREAFTCNMPRKSIVYLHTMLKQVCDTRCFRRSHDGGRGLRQAQRDNAGAAH